MNKPHPLTQQEFTVQADSVFSLCTDVVIFTLRDDALMVLLLRKRGGPCVGQWALPGGMIGADEDLDAAARRQLEQEAGMTGVYLEQLYSFGHPHRDPRKRVISIAYFALVPINRTHGHRDDDPNLAWLAVDSLPPLALDHLDIVRMARERLVAKLDYSTIALQFMPRSFTLSELQKVYEILVGHPLDKRNFRKRLLASGCLEETDKARHDGAHRPARLYRAKRPHCVDLIK